MVTSPRRDPEPSRKTLNDALVNPDTYAAGVEEGWDEVSLYRLIVRQLQRSFHGGTHADRLAMLKNRPRTTGTKWDAVAAAVIEHAATTHGYAPPPWTEEPERFLNELTPAIGPLPWPLPRGTVAGQPAPFLRRGVLIDPRDLDGRAGDGRRWMAEP